MLHSLLEQTASQSASGLNTPTLPLKLGRADRAPFFLFKLRVDLLEPRSKRRLAPEAFLGGCSVPPPPDNLVGLRRSVVPRFDPYSLSLALEQIDHARNYRRASGFTIARLRLEQAVACKVSRIFRSRSAACT